MLPDSKARTKIAKDRNASVNSASAKNKAVAANRAVAVHRAAATSKADDRAWSYPDYLNGGGQLPPFAFPCADRLQLQINLQPPHS